MFCVWRGRTGPLLRDRLSDTCDIDRPQTLFSIETNETAHFVETSLECLMNESPSPVGVLRVHVSLRGNCLHILT